MNVEYPDLTDYLAIAAGITGIDVKTVASATNLDLADSALHAQASGTRSSIPTFATKQPCSWYDWQRTTPFPMETSGRPG